MQRLTESDSRRTSETRCEQHGTAISRSTSVSWSGPLTWLGDIPIGEHWDDPIAGQSARSEEKGEGDGTTS
jgi:hypothetical protein